MAIPTESDQSFPSQTSVATWLRRAAAVREEVRVSHRVKTAGRPARSVNHVHEFSVFFLKPFVLDLADFETRPCRIETYKERVYTNEKNQSIFIL